MVVLEVQFDIPFILSISVLFQFVDYTNNVDNQSKGSVKVKLGILTYLSILQSVYKQQLHEIYSNSNCFLVGM